MYVDARFLVSLSMDESMTNIHTGSFRYTW